MASLLIDVGFVVQAQFLHGILTTRHFKSAYRLMDALGDADRFEVEIDGMEGLEETDG